MSQLTPTSQNMFFPDKSFYQCADFLPSFTVSRQTGTEEETQHFYDCMIAYDSKQNHLAVFQDIDDGDEETMFISISSIDPSSITYEDEEETITFKSQNHEIFVISTMDLPMLRKLMNLLCIQKGLTMPEIFNDKKYQSDDEDDSDFEEGDEDDDEQDDEEDEEEDEDDDQPEDQKEEPEEEEGEDSEGSQ